MLDEEKLEEEGWYDADLLDMKIISFVLENDFVSRNDVKEEFGISIEKSRSRLEGLVEQDIINKVAICSNCEEPIGECKCGKYMKKIRYFQEEFEAEFVVEEMEELTEKLKVFNGVS